MSAVDNAISAMNDLTQVYEAKKDEIDSSLLGHASSVDEYIAGARGESSHFRTSKNQVLESNEDGSFPWGWNSGILKSAVIVEHVVSGVDPVSRSALQREFLSAINCDVRTFNSDFYIWQLEYFPNRSDVGAPDQYSYMMYQISRGFSGLTVAAIVKHVSGVVPVGFWCDGLVEGESAKVCGRFFGTARRNGSFNCHPYVYGEGLSPDDSVVVQVALPAVVTGYVDLSKTWGLFPYLDFDAGL